MQHCCVILDSPSRAPLSGWCGLEFWQNTLASKLGVEVTLVSHLQVA